MYEKAARIILATLAALAVSSGAAAARPLASDSFTGWDQTPTTMSALGLVSTVPVGQQPSAIAIDLSNHTVYVANTASNSVSIVSGANQQAIAMVPVGSSPKAIVVDPVDGKVDVANQASGTLSVLDKSSNQLVDTVSVGQLPESIAFDPTNHLLYVGNDSSTLANTGAAVQILDGANDRVVGTIPIGSDSTGNTVLTIPAVAVDPSTHDIFIGSNQNDGPSSLEMVDASSHAPLASVLTAGPITGVAVDPTNHRVVATMTNGLVDIFDGTAATSFGTRPITVTIGGSPVGVAIDPSTQTAYVVTSNGSLVAIDDTSGQIIQSVMLGKQPAAVAVDSSTHQVYVADVGTSAVEILSGVSDVPVASHDERYFSATGYRIANDTIWNYFNRRGGVATFGYPTSRTFVFQGYTVQFFQRRIVQISHQGSPRLLNILDSGLLPYTSFNGASFPALDSNLVASAPSSTDATATLAFVKAHVPDTFQGKPVNFYQTFLGTVPASAAYPKGGSNPDLLPGFDLEMWGIPTSQPALDPNNHDVVYLRWQRGIMMYDAQCNCTQSVLLADYLKEILTAQNLPSDLRSEAEGSPLFGQYDPSRSSWVHDPALLPYTDMTKAFTPE